VVAWSMKNDGLIHEKCHKEDGICPVYACLCMFMHENFGGLIHEITWF
jgi:hypothetical protein